VDYRGGAGLVGGSEVASRLVYSHKEVPTSPAFIASGSDHPLCNNRLTLGLASAADRLLRLIGDNVHCL
jgi:hypothetical protein